MERSKVNLSILIKDLVRVYQDCVNDLDLPAGICDGGAGIGAHERGTEDDGQIVGVHAIDVGVVNDAVQVEHEGAEGRVVGVGQAVDDGVKVVSADDFVFVFYSWSGDAKEKGGGRGVIVLAALMKLLWCSVVNSGSGRSRKNCFNRPVTLLTSWKKFSGFLKSSACA